MRCKLGLLLLPFAAFPTAARAAEPAGIPALQNGPVGEGPAFATYGSPDAEITYATTTISGEERQGEESRLVSGRAALLGLGGATAITPDLHFAISAFHGESDVGMASGKPALGTRERTTRRSVTRDELTAGPGVWLGDTFFAARASIVALGEARFETDEGEAVASAATVPTMSLYAGDRLGLLTLQARVRLYNDGTAKLNVGSSNRRIKRRLPASGSLDGRAEVTPTLSFGAYVTATQYDRASEGTEDDAFRYGFGGLYHPVPDFALSGGLHHAEARFASDDDASAVAGNLGGNRVDVGAHVGAASGVGSFDLSYLVPERARVLPEGSPDERTIERSEWNLEFGWTRRW